MVLYLNRKELLVFILLIFASTGTTYAIMSSSINIQNVGEVSTIGVKAYWGPDETVEVTEIDWGLCNPGTTKSTIIYIKNSGNLNCTLSLQTQNWNPANASNYISLIWNYTGQIIKPEQIIPIELKITISDQISGIDQFSFEVIISAYET